MSRGNDSRRSGKLSILESETFARVRRVADGSRGGCLRSRCAAWRLNARMKCAARKKKEKLILASLAVYGEKRPHVCKITVEEERTRENVRDTRRDYYLYARDAGECIIGIDFIIPDRGKARTRFRSYESTPVMHYRVRGNKIFIPSGSLNSDGASAALRKLSQ